MNKKEKKPTTELSLENFKSSLVQSVKSKENKIELKEFQNSKFPLGAFPQKMQEIIKDFHSANLLPIDFYGLTVLTIVGGLIGNTYVLQYKNNHYYSPVIYGCIVGNSSIGKSPVLRILLQPVFQIEKEFDREYKNKNQEWEVENENQKKGNPTPKPERNNILLSDSTVEALYQAHRINRRGLISFNDELIAWLNSQNQYRSGSDNEFWLSAWSGNPIKVNRASKDTLFIPDPSIAVIGGIQPKVLKSLIRKNNKDNGFLFRMLFAYPSDVKKPYETDKEIDEQKLKNYYNIIKSIFSIELEVRKDDDGKERFGKTPIPISPDGKKKYIEWKNNLTDEINSVEDDGIASLLGKIETYCLRFALILHILELVCKKKNPTIKGTEVSLSTIEKSIHLSEYFKINGLKVLDKIEISNPVEDLSENMLKLYKMLPEEFTTQQGKDLAEKLSIPSRTFQRHLKKHTDLFIKVKHGIYRKRY